MTLYMNGWKCLSDSQQAKLYKRFININEKEFFYDIFTKRNYFLNTFFKYLKEDVYLKLTISIKIYLICLDVNEFMISDNGFCCVSLMKEVYGLTIICQIKCWTVVKLFTSIDELSFGLQRKLNCISSFL